MMQMRKFHPILRSLNKVLMDLPAPMNLSLMWNMGSILGLCLGLQLMSGTLLTMHYTPNVDISFYSLTQITRDISFGWLLRNIHMNGASIFFMVMYLHMLRSMYFMSFKLKEVWMIGVTIYIITMATAFMGYLLPWGQMSFWGATVITNLFSALPYVGTAIVEWLWGGFGVNNPTLTRFFTLHFLLPFVILALVGLHIIYLHQTGSNNPLGLSSNNSKTPFHYMFTSKDLLGFTWLILILMFMTMLIPNYLGDPENFIPANSLITPTHIKPEWYFLWAYAILRSIPNKLGGVVTMFAAILILYAMPMMNPPNNFYSKLLYEITMWAQLVTLMLLTWVGGCPVEHPYETIGLILTITYFVLLFFVMML